MTRDVHKGSFDSSWPVLKGWNLRVGTMQNIIIALGVELQLKVALNDYWHTLSIPKK